MNSTPEPFELMNVEQAADFLGFSRYTIRSWVAAERIPFLRVAGSIRFERQDLVDWARAERQASKSRHPSTRRVPLGCCGSTERSWTRYEDGITVENHVHAATCERAAR